MQDSQFCEWVGAYQNRPASELIKVARHRFVSLTAGASIGLRFVDKYTHRCEG